MCLDVGGEAALVGAWVWGPGHRGQRGCRSRRWVAAGFLRHPGSRVHADVADHESQVPWPASVLGRVFSSARYWGQF